MITLFNYYFYLLIVIYFKCPHRSLANLFSKYISLYLSVHTRNGLLFSNIGPEYILYVVSDRFTVHILSTCQAILADNCKMVRWLRCKMVSYVLSDGLPVHIRRPDNTYSAQAQYIWICLIKDSNNLINVEDIITQKR